MLSQLNENQKGMEALVFQHTQALPTEALRHEVKAVEAALYNKNKRKHDGWGVVTGAVWYVMHFVAPSESRVDLLDLATGCSTWSVHLLLTVIALIARSQPPNRIPGLLDGRLRLGLLRFCHLLATELRGRNHLRSVAHYSQCVIFHRARVVQCSKWSGLSRTQRLSLAP